LVTKEEIQEKARRAQERLAQAGVALESFVGQIQENSPAAASGAARTHQEAISHLMDALSLLNEVATRASTTNDFPYCMRCDKPVDRLGIWPRPDNPEVMRVEYECHNEVVRQELSASIVEGGLSRYSAFNAYTSGLMPMNPDERA
jgi:hypothetical protein